jgi:hypothetical protein
MNRVRELAKANERVELVKKKEKGNSAKRRRSKECENKALLLSS